MTKNQVHEWHESLHDDEGKHYKQYYRGYWDSRAWRFQTTGPNDAEWLPLENPTLETWEALRDVLWRKYQRKRINYKLVEKLDEVLEELRGGPTDK